MPKFNVTRTVYYAHSHTLVVEADDEAEARTIGNNKSLEPHQRERMSFFATEVEEVRELTGKSLAERRNA